MADRIYARRKRTDQERVLAAWRGVDGVDRAVEKAPTARSAAALLPLVVKGIRLEKRRGETEIVQAWNNLLDPNLTAHAQPVGIHHGTLFVNVDNSVWLDEIVRYQRREILQRLQHCFGRDMIKRISFRIG